jgi:hypothetical protein
LSIVTVPSFFHRIMIIQWFFPHHPYFHCLGSPYRHGKKLEPWRYNATSALLQQLFHTSNSIVL